MKMTLEPDLAGELDNPELSPGARRMAPRSGDLCPRCALAPLDYDGLLNLSCPECGYTVGGCFT